MRSDWAWVGLMHVHTMPTTLRVSSWFSLPLFADQRNPLLSGGYHKNIVVCELAREATNHDYWLTTIRCPVSRHNQNCCVVVSLSLCTGAHQ